ncbi:MAG: hypothetical protein KKD39_01695 [Candidatus Altiarchaeota archaeon]|nr:hypothetical protein [Candidatus Altiarchaeota archaeon]
MISADEILELTKSMTIVSLIFTIAYSVGAGYDMLDLILLFLLCLVCVGMGFVLHEVAHKVVASFFGLETRYVANNSMPLVSLLLALGGFILISPGAVRIYGIKPIDLRRAGLISVAGPASNLFISLLFYAMYQVTSGFLSFAAGFGYEINSWLAVFNMIPVPGFDGAKVFAWNKVAYIFLALACVFAAFFL